jgi:hypothetical protein
MAFVLPSLPRYDMPITYGAVALRSSGYVLPNRPETQERYEWLATAIRKYKGQFFTLGSLTVTHSYAQLCANITPLSIEYRDAPKWMTDRELSVSGRFSDLLRPC